VSTAAVAITKGREFRAESTLFAKTRERSQVAIVA